jgi:hypothetical protein
VAGGANAFDVVVEGQDAPAFVAALECARYGFRVAVIVDPKREVFLPPEFSHHNGSIAELCDLLKVRYDIIDQAPDALAVAGVPGNPFSPGVRSALGWSGAWRVYLDRLKPLLQIGNEESFDRLVRRRLGSRALRDLVQPEVTRLYGTQTSDLGVTAIAPGLTTAMSRVGSLTAGVLELIADEPRWAQAVHITGGTQVLVDALAASLEYFAVQRVTPKQAEKLKATVWLLDVAASAEHPAWELQVPHAKEAAEAARVTLLSDPENPPVGPIDLGL